MFKFDKSAGQASRTLLVLAIIVFVAVIIVYLVMQMTAQPPKPVKPATTVAPVPVYEQQLGNIDFIFKSSVDRGNILTSTEAVNNQYGSQKDLATTERFIQVTVGAKNMGTMNTEQNSWDIGNIVDSQGRNFIPDDNYTVGPWLPADNSCGVLLKPAFDPAPCTKIYEVSKESTGLKIQVETGVNNTANNFSSGKIQSSLLDLIFN